MRRILLAISCLLSHLGSFPGVTSIRESLKSSSSSLDDYDPFLHANYKTLDTVSEQDEFDDPDAHDDGDEDRGGRFGLIHEPKDENEEDNGQVTLYDEPRMDNSSEETVWVVLGKPVELHCQVRNLGERALSWLRKRDFHILTTGAYIFTNDDRFGISHQAGSDLWSLQIKEAQQRDNGTYECQVPTGNGTLIKKVHLHVVVPEAFILGSKEFHVEKGSTITLVCIIEKSPEPPESVMWYHNDKMLNEDASRGGVSVSTEKDTKTHSRLVITDARYSDSGNYMCSADNAKPASIAVFVSGDKTAAIQRRKGSATHTRGNALLLLLAFILASTLPSTTYKGFIISR